MSNPRYWGEGTPFPTEADHKAAWALITEGPSAPPHAGPRRYLGELASVLIRAGLAGDRENHPVIEAIAPTIDGMVREMERLRAGNAELAEALQWYIDNDDICHPLSFYGEGQAKAIRAIERAREVAQREGE